MATIPNMFELLPAASAKPVPFSGADFDPKRDRARLTRQIDCITYTVLNGGREWWTIPDLAGICAKRFPWMRFPHNSVQAQLRNLRKVGYTVEKKNIADSGYFCAYKVTPPAEASHGL